MGADWRMMPRLKWIKHYVSRAGGWRGGVPTSEQLASRRIAEAQRTGATKIDLSILNLSRLPPELWNLTSFTGLDLSHNRLWRLRSELWTLTALKQLDLSRNILPELPLEIRNLTDLRNLDLTGNYLSKLPAELWDLRSLTDLNSDVTDSKSHTREPSTHGSVWHAKIRLVVSLTFVVPSK